MYFLTLSSFLQSTLKCSIVEQLDLKTNIYCPHHGKVQFLFLSNFFQVLTSFAFSEEAWSLGNNSMKFWGFAKSVSNCPEDVPRMSPSNVLRTFPKYPIWSCRGRPYLTSRQRPNLTLQGHPKHVHLFSISLNLTKNKIVELYIGICSYSIHIILFKVNFPMYRYLKHYREIRLTKHFLDDLEGHFCSHLVHIQWAETESGRWIY